MYKISKRSCFAVKRLLKCIAIILAILMILLIINFIPTWNLQTAGMQKLSGNWVNVYYEQEEAAAIDVFEYADSETARIAQVLGFTQKQDVAVYIYDQQSTMQTKKYGYIAPLLNLDWYIGDNIGTNVILTSPANPGPIHDYNNNKYAVLHEIVHAYVSVINKDIDLWLTEGTALYLSNGEPFFRDYIDWNGIPTYQDTCSNNPLTFSNCGGYTFATTYIEYIDVTYGWNCVLQLLETEDYELCFGKSQKEIYAEWTDYISNYPQ